jgi:hypothetical protein
MTVLEPTAQQLEPCLTLTGMMLGEGQSHACP